MDEETRIDEVTKNVIDIFTDEIYWMQLMEDKKEENEIIRRLKVSISTELRRFYKISQFDRTVESE